MSKLYSKPFKDGEIGKTMRLISLENGLQTYLFYSIRLADISQSKYMGMIEVLLNGDEKIIVDWEETSNPNSDDTNYGPITINGAPS